jgi:hypothetical protein
MPHRWRSIIKGKKHPQLIKEKKERHEARRKTRIDERKAKDKSRRAIAKAAEKAERKTEQEIIKATRNSGRARMDGDHLYAGNITLDTKKQDNFYHTVIPTELEKVRADSRRAGTIAGGLVLVNCVDRRVVVFALEDLPKVVSWLNH